MKTIKFRGANVEIAKNQDEYLTVDAFATPEGDVITCWELSEEEKATVAETGVVWLSIKTFRRPLQPMYMTVNRKDLITYGEEVTAPEWVEMIEKENPKAYLFKEENEISFYKVNFDNGLNYVIEIPFADYVKGKFEDEEQAQKLVKWVK